MDGLTPSGTTHATLLTTRILSYSIPLARMPVSPGRPMCQRAIYLIHSRAIRIRARSATTSRSFQTIPEAVWRSRPHSTSTRTCDNLKKTFTTFVFFQRADLHPRRHLLSVRQRQRQLRLLLQRRQQPQLQPRPLLHQLLLLQRLRPPRPDRRRRRGWSQRRGPVPLQRPDRGETSS